MYWPVCRSECEAVQNKCGAIPNLNCSQFQDNAYECSRLLSSSQFQIPFGSRDESAFSVYLLSTLFALALFAWWTVLFVRYHTQSTSLHTFLTVLLCMNLLADAVNTVVYRSIAANRGVGSIFQGMLVVCVQLLYDTLFIFVLLVVTKGWCVLFASLLGSEWCRYYALSILFYCTEGLLLIYNVEKTSPVLFHALCLLLFLLLAAEMAVTVHYAIFKTRMKLERMFRDGLDPYAHPTFFKYRTFVLLLGLLALKTLLMLCRHLLFPLARLDDSRPAIALFAALSDNLVLLLLALLYRPRLESRVFLSGSADDSDFVVMVSVVLTRRMKEGESVEKEREFVVVFPGEDNYGFAQKSFTVDAGDKECGQNVNKVNTKAEVRFNVYLATWLPENVKERFLTLEKNNINGRGEFVITSSEERFQDKNRAIALRKLQEKVDRACAEPKKRKLKTDVDPLVKKKWVEDKRRRSELKQKRKGKEGGIEHF
ncbi:hypothetical protein AV274_6235 [Blastocystis sp. ATCC 50177/Nand II]|uniref:Prokaryotic-type class I peptide chain release factors domain-containing protein n=1 Tax=Blastocystis sp. subtype 1 (strain ATCC 50177 / NandII) TaxID=478820 RepID=A0A196S4R8_BLAHN|nr:hypothetical protein AV274_6235 [Blastocystis sp. ATCC 50177/Nand II]